MSSAAKMTKVTATESWFHFSFVKEGSEGTLSIAEHLIGISCHLIRKLSKVRIPSE